jgi:outer membrane lipoprotein-sorting protein
MRRYGFVTVALATAAVISIGQAQAQANDPLTRFLDGLFDKQAPTAKLAPAAPRSPAAVAPSPNSGGTALPQLSAPSAPAGEAIAATPPLPPRRPANLGGASQPIETVADHPAPSSGNPPAQVVAAAPPQPAAPAQAAVPTTREAAIARVNAYVNSIDTLTGRFVQYGGDGRRAEGTISIQRPGRLRFAYNAPSTLEIVADGRSVAIRDSKLKTNDVYPIGQTPLKFLLKDGFDLNRDTRLKAVDIGDDGVISVTFEDSATIGGTSRVTLRFDARSNTLKQWTVVDPQGYETSIALSDLRQTARAD